MFQFSRLCWYLKILMRSLQLCREMVSFNNEMDIGTIFFCDCLKFGLHVVNYQFHVDKLWFISRSEYLSCSSWGLAHRKQTGGLIICPSVKLMDLFQTLSQDGIYMDSDWFKSMAYHFSRHFIAAQHMCQYMFILSVS